MELPQWKSKRRKPFFFSQTAQAARWRRTIILSCTELPVLSILGFQCTDFPLRATTSQMCEIVSLLMAASQFESGSSRVLQQCRKFAAWLYDFLSRLAARQSDGRSSVFSSLGFEHLKYPLFVAIQPSSPIKTTCGRSNLDSATLEKISGYCLYKSLKLGSATKWTSTPFEYFIRKFQSFTVSKIPHAGITPSPSTNTGPELSSPSPHCIMSRGCAPHPAKNPSA